MPPSSPKSPHIADAVSISHERSNPRKAMGFVKNTVKELGSPLAAVGDSIKLVRGGPFGLFKDQQIRRPESAEDQWPELKRLMEEIVESEQQQIDHLEVHRQGVSIVEIRDAVENALGMSMASRGISLLWDIDDDPDLLVFADRKRLCRLLVDLVTRAIRSSYDGSFVLIRVARVSRGQAVRWSVVDRGPGTREQATGGGLDRRVVTRRTDVEAGGLGSECSESSFRFRLSVSRQLAAIHFSPLRIRSRFGKGTEFSFETATSGPRSVARAWTRWRIGFTTAGRRQAVDHNQLIPCSRNDGGRQIRLDRPTVSLSLSQDAARPRSDSCFAVASVCLGATVPTSTIERFDRSLQSHLELFDFAYRAGTRRWVLCLDANEDSAGDRFHSIARILQSRTADLRMTWSKPETIALDRSRVESRLSDLLARETLAASCSDSDGDCEGLPAESEPLADCGISEARLDAQVESLRTFSRLASMNTWHSTTRRIGRSN